MANGSLSGSGTANDPYIVEDADDLNTGVRNIITNHNTQTFYFKQIKDIDLSKFSNLVPVAPYWDANYNLVPGYYYYGFTPLQLGGSVYDGNNYKINNLYIEEATTGEYCGLFSFLSGGGYVKNIVLNNAKVIAHVSLYVGALLGSTYSGNDGTFNEKGTIDNCTVQSSLVENQRVSNTGYIGGVLGRGDSTLLSFSGNISGYGNIGGIIGAGSASECKCEATINVNKVSDDNNLIGCGGIIGRSLGVSLSIFSGIIQGQADYCGGIIGYAYDIYNNEEESTIDQVAVYANIENSLSSGITGGIVGGPISTITNSYAIGNITVPETCYCGGIMGGALSSGGLTSKCCYVVVKINNKLVHSSNISAFGTLFTPEECNLFDNQLITDNVLSIYGKTESKLRDTSTYMPYNWLNYNYNINGAVKLNTDYIDYGYADIGTNYIASTYFNNKWNTVNTRFITGTAGSPDGSLWLGASLGQTVGDFYVYLDIHVTPNIYRVLQWNGNSYVQVQTYDNTTKIKWLYIYDNRYVDLLNSNNNYFSIDNTVYRFYTNDVSANGPFDFNTTWIIDSKYNNGYPYLKNVDTSIIPISVIGYLKFKATDRLVTIPLYRIDNSSNALVVNMGTGLVQINSVDTTDSKASPCRIKTNNGIKSWSM